MPFDKLKMNVINSGPGTLPEAMELDNLMRCPICFDHFNTAMILPSCSHNYCSLCIRKYFQFKTKCPMCGMPAADPDLRNNRILDSIVKQFLEFRKKVVLILNKKPADQLQSGVTLTSPVSCPGNKAFSSSSKHTIHTVCIISFF
ncbi:E3 ubiquitin-protein ligase RAD18-like [Gigantopelta aegis]|uniref:E3 ubiquitin-protein ligase RAD18-like n=1 Tax=Gigantopelta aegis TaxID=1735272 RepID=UPI001B887D71|nr:E3 ubiquitin-protein ligase RAD18-like [Gigantopelta aegis]